MSAPRPPALRPHHDGGGYVELQVTTNFTFLTGASHPEEMVARAAELGYAAIGIADHNSLAGVVRAHVAAGEAGIRLIVGARLDFEDAPPLLCYPTDRAAYGRLSQLITLGRRRAAKGACRLTRDDLLAHAEGQRLIVIPPERPDAGFARALAWYAARVPCHLAASCRYAGADAARLAQLAALAEAHGAPLIATNDVAMHEARRRPLADVLTCIRSHCTIDEAGGRLAANAERHLKAPAEMARLFRAHPGALERARALADACRFSLEELRYEYPIETETPDADLARLTHEGMAGRYPSGAPQAVRRQVAYELDLIRELGYAPYFLTVADIVRFARGRDILCQGRGSAANSAVCYCLGITAVDPARLDLLFERFISAERNEPPDIDVDFEHERREEVIQYIYEKYGRDRAGLTATVISYRTRSALREVGKAMGLTADTIDALARQIWGRSRENAGEEAARAAGLASGDRRLALVLRLARELTGFPRHLSQHVGGFVITRGRLDALAPIENAAMAERTVIEWDKDDLDALGILKVDILALGMLTCLRKGFALLERHAGVACDLARVPAGDAQVYDMLARADSLGVFQVESRAQMAFLPRMRPRRFYDLVIEVAIVRPGPIQGDMVHPYLRRRNGEEAVTFPSAELEAVLGKTLGVPLFQEQAMRIAIVAAGFTPSEADRLRRAMATFRKTGTIHLFRDKMVEGMVARGYERDFAERCFKQIEGFGEYGFPESHAASFALLVYVSAWLKCHYPAVFACALLNSQPMGFYAPAQIVRDAREHGVVVRPPDVNASAWDCTLEPSGEPTQGGGVKKSAGAWALRLGLRMVKGLASAAAERIVAECVATTGADRAFVSVADLQRRAGLDGRALEALARADAFGSLGLARRQGLWAVKALGAPPLPLFAAAPLSATSEARTTEARPALPIETAGEAVAGDYAALRLSLKHHPLRLLRARMAALGAIENARLLTAQPERRVTVAGLVLVRQRPGTAKGVIFMTLEDETGVANIIVWPDVFTRYRSVVLGSRLVAVTGRLQRQGIVAHVIAAHVENLSPLLDALAGGPLNHAKIGNHAKMGDHAKTGNPVTAAHALPPPANFRSASRDFH